MANGNCLSDSTSLSLNSNGSGGIIGNAVGHSIDLGTPAFVVQTGNSLITAPHTVLRDRTGSQSNALFTHQNGGVVVTEDGFYTVYAHLRPGTVGTARDAAFVLADAELRIRKTAASNGAVTEVGHSHVFNFTDGILTASGDSLALSETVTLPLLAGDRIDVNWSFGAGTTGTNYTVSASSVAPFVADNNLTVTFVNALA